MQVRQNHETRGNPYKLTRLAPTRIVMRIRRCTMLCLAMRQQSMNRLRPTWLCIRSYYCQSRKHIYIIFYLRIFPKRASLKTITSPCTTTANRPLKIDNMQIEHMSAAFEKELHQFKARYPMCDHSAGSTTILYISA